MVRVLVVEDEANIREMIALNLRLTGMEAVEAESAEAALPLLAKKPGCDAAILDVMLPGMNGFSLCETIRRTDQKIGIIILSAKGQEQDKIRGVAMVFVAGRSLAGAMKRASFPLLQKPFS